MSGPEIAYAATQCAVGMLSSGTTPPYLRYRPTRSLCDVQLCCYAISCTGLGYGAMPHSVLTYAMCTTNRCYILYWPRLCCYDTPSTDLHCPVLT
eukprot:588845-Rhodomonas_salina.2